ncbi:MAG: hypothetical protein K0S31_2354 [Sphingobacterium multivorum]|jgi:hypothetical protein|nr:hypothetical protein [Sphingobacterium multivorum]
MCTCIDDQEKRILEHLCEQFPEREYDKQLNSWQGTGFKNKAIVIGDKKGIFLYQEFCVNYTFTKTNGEKSKEKKQTINLNPSYCIFCGEKFDQNS